MLIEVNGKGQITLPKLLREEMGIKPGDRVVIWQENDELRLRPLTKTLFDFIDISSSDQEEEEWEAIRQAAKDRLGRKFMQEMEDDD
jgi:AbrB family looped-hinge helix DNA binding protein